MRSVAGGKAFTSQLVAGLVLFALLGMPDCKVRDTGGYCQCEKICPIPGGEDGCVATNDPRYGCASVSCAQCSFDQAMATCDNNGACALGGCKPGHMDCDGDELNGCETDYLNSVGDCGACSRSCPNAQAHTDIKCELGLCVVSCRDGYRNCNSSDADGCEAEPGSACDTGT